MVKKTKARSGAKPTALPKPAIETPTVLPDEACSLARSLLKSTAAAADVAVSFAVSFGQAVGEHASLAVVVCGDDDRAVEVFAFVRAHGAADDVNAVAIEVANAVVADVVKALTAGDTPKLPLDWQGQVHDGPYDIFVRGETRRYALEEEAARLLGEPPLPRALPLLALPRLND